MKSKFTCVETADLAYGLIQHLTEIDELVKFILSHQPMEDFIEIGSCRGGTFYVLSSLISGNKISIDYCDGAFGGTGISSLERNKKLSWTFTDTYFIEGDSHKYETVEKLKNILGNKKVSLLFIDGDHTEDGCFKDLMMYRQFVKQDGYIVFHDIKDCDFHRRIGCRVDKVWQLIKELPSEYYYELMSGDENDCSISSSFGTTEKIWGGIGILENKVFFDYNDIHIFQVFHNQSSLDMCFDTLESKEIKYLPTLVINTEKKFHENAVIKNIYQSYKFKPNNFIGITSPRVREKTEIRPGVWLTLKGLVDVINENKDKDVVVYSPDYSWLKIKGLDVWQFNKEHMSDIYVAAEYLNEKSVLPFDLFYETWYECYCNYWITKTEIFENYCKNILIPSMNFFEYDREWPDFEQGNNKLNKKLKMIHRGEDYPIAIFVLEGLFGSFVANNIFKIKDIYNAN